jgi:hypothetical protein
MLADFAMPMAGAWIKNTVVVDVAVTAGPVGGVPDAVAVLVMLPLSTSAWVVV